MKKILLFVMTALAFVNAQNTAPTLADAQKAYVSGDWKNAATAYEAVCPSQPAKDQVSCNLWGILALSQVGDAKSFKKAGTKLDSLIGTTSPQHANYADLVMTRAQFMLYLGKYDKAAEDLIHAIETSQPSQNIVLQKVCTAVLSRTKSESLSERCEGLKHPEAQVTKPAENTPPKQDSSEIQPKKEENKTAGPAQQPAQGATPEVKSDSTVQNQASAPQQASQPDAKVQPGENPVQPAAVATVPAVAPAKPAEEYWILQLGAFGVKNNASLLVSNLKKQKIQSVIVELPREDRTLYLVQTGHFSSKEEANSYGEKVLTPLNVEFQPLIKK